MVEQTSASELPKQTVWFGVGNALEGLGPKAWEQRAKAVIETRIIPAVSPAWQERWEKNADIIAKATGWVATAAEVGIVAGVTYGGYKGVRLLLDKRMQPSVPVRSDVPLPKAHEKIVSIRVKKINESMRAFQQNEKMQRRLILERIKAADAKKPGVIQRILRHRRSYRPSWESKRRPDSLMYRIREGIRTVHLSANEPHLSDAMTKKERLMLALSRRISASGILPVGMRARALEREILLNHTVRRRMNPRRHTVNIDRIKRIAMDTPRRVEDVVGRVRDVRHMKRVRDHMAQQQIKTQRMDEFNANARAQILIDRARREYEQWSASLGTSPVADVLRQAEILLHHAGDETVQNLVERLGSMPRTTMIQQVEQSRVAAQLFSYVLEKRPELQQQFGKGSAKDGVIAAKATDWVRKNLPGISYLS